MNRVSIKLSGRACQAGNQQVQRPKDHAWWRKGEDSSVVVGVKEAMGRPGPVGL